MIQEFSDETNEGPRQISVGPLGCHPNLLPDCSRLDSNSYPPVCGLYFNTTLSGMKWEKKKVKEKYQERYLMGDIESERD